LVTNKHVHKKRPNERIVRINIVLDSRILFDVNDEQDEDIETILLVTKHSEASI